MTATYMTQLVLPTALFCIMVGVGLTLQFADFRRLLVRPGPVLLGLSLQLLCLPLLAVGLVSVLNLPPPLAVGLLVVAFAPGGATSNMITLLVRGDTALSISLTAISSLVTPLSLPLLTWLALQWLMPQASSNGFPVLATMARLVLIAVVPVLLGMLVRHYAPRLSLKVQAPVKWLSLLFLLIVVVGIIKANQARLAEIVLAVGPAALLLMMLALGLGYLVARWWQLPPEQALTLAIETGVQNAGTALLVTAGVLHDPLISASALCYGVVMNLPVLVLIGYRNLPRRHVA